MGTKGLGPQGLGTSKNNGYTIGEGGGKGCGCKGICQCGKSPMKQSYSEATSRFKNFDTKNDTIIRGKSIDLPTANKIVKFNSRPMGKAYDEESTFKESDGSYSVMRKYKKNPPAKQAVKDACYKKVKATYDVFPSAYASGAIAKCRKNKGK